MILVNNSKRRLLAFLRAWVAVIFRLDQPNTQNGNQLCLIYLLAASVEKRISFVISRWRGASVESDSCHVGGDFGDGPPPQLTPALLNTCRSRRRRRYARWIYPTNSLTDTWLFASGLGGAHRQKEDNAEHMFLHRNKASKHGEKRAMMGSMAGGARTSVSWVMLALGGGVVLGWKCSLCSISEEVRFNGCMAGVCRWGKCFAGS